MPDRWKTTLACAALAVTVPALARPAPQTPAPQAGDATQSPRPVALHRKPAVDRSGRPRVGKASVYSHKFAGRKMADGTPMDPDSDSAASKTLPLGTVAKVTNLQTGQSAVVTVRDRGPHVPGRIVDLSPATAQQVGIDHRQGVAKVAVTPLRVPPRDADGGAPQGPSDPAPPDRAAPRVSGR